MEAERQARARMERRDEIAGVQRDLDRDFVRVAIDLRRDLRVARPADVALLLRPVDGQVEEAPERADLTSK